MFVHLPMDAPSQGDTVGHAGTDLPASIEPLCHVTFLIFACRRTPRRQSWDTEPHEKW